MVKDDFLEHVKSRIEERKKLWVDYSFGNGSIGFQFIPTQCELDDESDSIVIFDGYHDIIIPNNSKIIFLDELGYYVITSGSTNISIY